MRYFTLLLAGLLGSVTGQYRCEYPSIYDFPTLNEYPDLEYPWASSGQYPPSTRDPYKFTTTPRQPTTRIPMISTTGSVRPSVTINRPPPPRINTVPTATPFLGTVISRIGNDLNSIQQTQMRELYCLEVLDRLVASHWQEDIDKLSVNDLGTFSTDIKVPDFKVLYSNPESEWIQDEGMALNKLDKCVRNLVSKVAPRMDQEEINCLNRMYPEYLSRESKTARLTEKSINETSRDQLPFKSYFTYFELTELLFENKNIDALDAELRAIHEDMLEFYIKTEEDKTKKIFVVEQECDWKDARALREVRNEAARYQQFAQLVKSRVNRYLVSEILRKWVPGVIIPEYRYNLWSKARKTMDDEIQVKMRQFQNEKKDAQYLCTNAAVLALKFFDDQKAILFDKMKNASLSMELKTNQKYSYVVALGDLLKGKTDSRLSRVEVLKREFKDGHYCLTNFVRMIENHQRYMIASAFVNDVLPYASTYCLVKEMSAGLLNPRYCKCQGTFCEGFGLATVRAERFQLNLLPNQTYTVTTKSSYRPLPLDELIEAANQRIADQKFKTWWYRNQKKAAA